MKRYSTSYITGEMQTKALKWPKSRTLTIPNAVEVMQQYQCSPLPGENTKWNSSSTSKNNMTVSFHFKNVLVYINFTKGFIIVFLYMHIIYFDQIYLPYYSFPAPSILFKQLKQISLFHCDTCNKVL
jgi:hypothetical protein